MTIGKLLRKLRKEKGVGIKEMAKTLDLNYTYISKIENSKAMPSSEVLNKISNYFDYNQDELLLSAGRIPKDIEEILKNNPAEAIKYLRRRFGRGSETA